MAPPENVLFVCKLNPVTKDEDLEIIFGRFGKIVSCEVRVGSAARRLHHEWRLSVFCAFFRVCVCARAGARDTLSLSLSLPPSLPPPLSLSLSLARARAVCVRVCAGSNVLDDGQMPPKCPFLGALYSLDVRARRGFI